MNLYIKLSDMNSNFENICLYILYKWIRRQIYRIYIRCGEGKSDILLFLYSNKESKLYKFLFVMK